MLGGPGPCPPPLSPPLTGDTNIIYDSLPSTCHTPISLVKMVEGVDIFRHPNLCSDQMTNYIIRQQLQQDFISQSNATPTIPS